MKYIIRLLAALPMLGGGVASAILSVMAYKDTYLVAPAIFSWFAFIECFYHYEDAVRHLAVFIKLMAEDALTE